MSYSKKLSVVAALAVVLMGCQTVLSPSEGTLYYGFSRIDPDSEQVIKDAWVVVERDRITAVGDRKVPGRGFARTINMNGHYLMPGLIDGHAHLVSGPHKIEMKNGAPLVTIQTRDDITQFSARMALAFGVTTVRNPGGDPQAAARYDANIASGVWQGPEAFHAGAVIQPPPMGGASFAYPQTEEEWYAEAARQAVLGMTYFKLYVLLTEEELALGVAAARAHGLKAIAHLHEVSWAKAAKLGVEGLEHALPTSADLLEPAARDIYLAEHSPTAHYMYRWFQLADYDGPVFQELLHLLVERQVETNMTLIVNELTYNTDDLARVWPEEDQRYMHPENLAAAMQFIRASGFGWTPEDYTAARATMPKVLEFARRLYEAGVPMMIGTDGNGGGPFLAREAALHVEAGIPVWAVLRMATSDAAQMLNISERTGRIAPGYEADMVFLRQNPVEDIMALREVTLTVNNGETFWVEELLSELLGDK